MLLDLRLPGHDGFAWLAEQRAAGMRTLVIAITARGTEDQRVAGLRGGADDYVVKPFGLAELHARIEAVWRRCAGTELPHIGATEVDLAGHELRRGTTRIPLAAKETALQRYETA